MARKNPHSRQPRRTHLPSGEALAPTPKGKARGPEWRGPRQRQALVEWAKTLTPEWTFLHHHTFRTPIPPYHAMSAGAALNRWCSGLLPTATAGRSIFRLLLWSAEGHLTGNVHLHALSVCTPVTSFVHMQPRPRPSNDAARRRCCGCDQRAISEGPMWRRLKESWYHHHGIARIHPYDPKYAFGAERYVIKYILDERCLDWGVETW